MWRFIEILLTPILMPLMLVDIVARMLGRRTDGEDDPDAEVDAADHDQGSAR